MNQPSPNTLTEALIRHGIELADAQQDRLECYCQTLWKWNQQLNLTRHTDYEKFVLRDVVDSMHLAELLQSGEKVLDVGSGGGVPGIILAILRPDLQLTLCESIGKKALALESMVKDLGLPIEVYHNRAEGLLEENRYDVLTARAVGPLWKMCKWFEPHWASIGRLLAIKGPRWLEERNEARHRGFMRQLELRVAAKYPLPDTESESVILKIWLSEAAEK